MFLLFGLWSHPTVWASCLAVPSPSLQAIDADIPKHPQAALQAAQAQLDAVPNPPAWMQAQLYAIVAEAQTELNQPRIAGSAIDAANSRLDGLPLDNESRRLRVRLQLLRAEIATTESNSAAAGADIDKILAQLPDQSLEKTCALAERAIAYDFSGQPDRAVSAALTAYRAATAHSWRDAEVWSAYTLAVDFREAGLFEEAQKMMSVVIDIETADGRSSSLITSEYEQGKIFIETAHFAQARAAFERMQEYAEQTGDRMSVAAANVPLCRLDLLEGDWSAADTACFAGRIDLAAGDRADFLALQTAYQARLDLERRNPAAALAKLESIFSQPLHALLPTYEPQIVRDLGRTYAALHRYREAYDSLARANDLEKVSHVEERNRHVAVLSAVIASQQITAKNVLLEAQMSRQRQELSSRDIARRLWLMLAMAGACCSAALIALLVLAWRHTEGLRRHESILRSVSNRAPDAILLLDEMHRVRFANRNLLGAGPLPSIGQPLVASVPAQVGEILSTAIQEASVSRLAVECHAEWWDPEGICRQSVISVLPAVDRGRILGYTIRSLDVTEMRALEREVVDSASLERQRLSSEIHEGLGQQLAGIMLMIGNLSAVAKRAFHKKIAELADEVGVHVAESIQSARELAKDLAPATIGYGSLSGALNSLGRDASMRLKIEVINECHIDDRSLTDLASDHLYRICREAITNAALHGRCTRARVELSVVQNSVVLRVSNDGDRLTQDQARLHGFGVKMMAYRARLLGGDLHFSEEAGVTALTVAIPLAHVATDRPQITTRGTA